MSFKNVLLCTAIGVSAQWTDSVSEETGAALCADGVVNGLRCSGSYCDNTFLHCNNGVKTALAGAWGARFSEEGENSYTCPGNSAVTGLNCFGKYCDDLEIRCSELQDTTAEDCRWTPAFSEEHGGTQEYGGQFVKGIRCTGSYCDNKEAYVCTPVLDLSGALATDFMTFTSGTCLSNGQDWITDEATCQNVGQELGFGSFYGPPATNRMKYCSIWEPNNGKYVHFNDATGGEVNGYDVRARCTRINPCICQPINGDRTCRTKMAYYPLNMNGQGRTVEPDSEACQARCAGVEGCTTFSFWEDGGCHLQDSNAKPRTAGAMASGSVSCLKFDLGLESAMASSVEPSKSTTACYNDAAQYLSLAAAGAKSSFIEKSERQVQDGQIIMNPSTTDYSFDGTCDGYGGDYEEAGFEKLCYPKCHPRDGWASWTDGNGPVCWGCPDDKPQRDASLCYPKCKSNERSVGFCCWTTKFPFKCNNRGVGVAQKSYGRGAGVTVQFGKIYAPQFDEPACRTRGWTSVAFRQNEAEMSVFTNLDQKITMLAFSPSKSFWINFASLYKDWRRYNDASLETYGFGVGDARINAVTKHSFDNLRDNSRSAVEAALALNHTIIFTGHSLGGSVAYTMALESTANWGSRPDAVITFGAPNPGLKDFNDLYRQHVGCDATLIFEATGIDDVAALYPQGEGYDKPCVRCKVDGKQSDAFDSHNIFKGYDTGVQAKLDIIYSLTPEVNTGCNVRV